MSSMRIETSRSSPSALISLKKIGSSLASCITRLKAGVISEFKRAEISFCKRSVSRTKIPPILRLMIRADSSCFVQRGFRVIISSQERIFLMCKGLNLTSQSVVVP